ncbi:glycosyltransferase [Tamlana sp. 2201CG12-4]|uniref:glycosyltransferase family 4 protein n=1 Tax=Tamlana sp. 2201CG12-4 TaxID=3112582 RepID=UPI002DB9C8CB|nr:glycosyltransferase [Tamlana sp. 2201CG12-4]MEC3907356.1 glycosyltransferase [Tamlana sp. 2201CG12-4]
MKFVVITHVEHKQIGQDFFAYAPYVREMNLWFKYIDEVEIVASLVVQKKSKIDLKYKHKKIRFQSIPSIQFTSISKAFLSLFKLPVILFALFKACKKADHIHLRCPGNIGLLGCLVQMFFPKKVKTAKYAGNWNPDSKQPLSYRLQKWILSNSFLTRNIKVLVYGNWKNQSKNIKPFFTATYNNSEVEKIRDKEYSQRLNVIFTGSLVRGKRPLLAIRIVESLYKQGMEVYLNVYGDGILRKELEDYVGTSNLDSIVSFHGNQPKETIKSALRTSHFSILPSKSEGWPKAIAEAMFFGVIPIATKVSCVPYMLDYGKRGILIQPNLEAAVAEIQGYLKDNKQLKTMSREALSWSQQYTLDVFEKEISKLLSN